MRDATLDVFTTVLGEVEPVPDALVELLLVSLLPSSRKGAPATHALAQQVVRRSSDALTRPVAARRDRCVSQRPNAKSASSDKAVVRARPAMNVLRAGAGDTAQAVEINFFRFTLASIGLH